jgi:hypothetical protein
MPSEPQKKTTDTYRKNYDKIFTKEGEPEESQDPPAKRGEPDKG